MSINKVQSILKNANKGKEEIMNNKITEVVKRNGTIEAFDPEKLNNWASWAIKDSKASWSEIVLAALKKLTGPRVDSEDLQTALIESAKDLIRYDVNYDVPAKELYLARLRKQVFDSYDPPSLKFWHDYLVSVGAWSDKSKWVSDSQFAALNEVIDHERDKLFSYGGLKQFADKYSRRSVKGNDLFETPQFMYMGMALELLSLPQYTMKDAVDLYNALSLQKINVPTPPLVGLRSGDRGFASCCLIDATDNLKSMDAANSAVFMMTAARAGIGLNLECRSNADPVRNGAFPHSGKLPYYRVYDRLVKANTQQSRGGSATVHYPYFDPEIMDLIKAKQQRTADDKRIDKLDYSLQFNDLLLKRYLAGKPITLMSYLYAPEVHEAFYSGDQEEFERVYEAAEKRLAGKTRPSSKGDKALPLAEVISATDIVENWMTTRLETGRAYAIHIGEVNRRSTFKDPVRMSNLCQEIVQPTKPFAHVKDLYLSEEEFIAREDKNDVGEISLCNLGGIVLGRVDGLEDWMKTAYVVLKFADALIDIQDYPFETLRHTAVRRRNVGIGLINAAGAQAALGFNYEGVQARNWFHQQSELFSYSLHAASVRLAKEQGAAPWFYKTHYSDGVLPIDNYKKTVDELVTVGLELDWESLRADILKYGMRNSVLEACMPSESSSVLISCTNGLEPVRDVVSVKASGVNVVVTVAPGADNWDTAQSYVRAFDLDSIEFIKFIAVGQKFFGQSISTNGYEDYRKFPNEIIPIKTLVKNFFISVKYGYKTWYYLNTDVTNGGAASQSACGAGGCTL